MKKLKWPNRTRLLLTKSFDVLPRIEPGKRQEQKKRERKKKPPCALWASAFNIYLQLLYTHTQKLYCTFFAPTAYIFSVLSSCAARALFQYLFSSLLRLSVRRSPTLTCLPSTNCLISSYHHTPVICPCDRHPLYCYPLFVIRKDSVWWR